MKQQNLLTKMLLLFALVVGSVTSVWADETKTEGFETKTAGNNYQSTITVSTEESDCGISWELYYGTVSTSNAITGSNSAALRLYTTNNYGYLKTTTAIDGLKKVSFNAKAATSNNSLVKINVSYSINGTTWIALETDVTTEKSSKNYEYNIPEGGKYFQIAISPNSTKPSKSNTQLTIDDVIFTYEAAASSPLASIAVSGNYPTSFYVNDEFSHEGAVVTATYEDASTKDVSASATFSTPDMTSTGKKTVTVSYTEGEVTKTTTYDITVNARPALTSIALSGTYTTIFEQGSTFNHDGVVVTATYADNSTKDVTADATFSTPDMTTLGTQPVTVSYTENEITKSTSYDITINEYVQPTNISINNWNTLFGTSNNGALSGANLKTYTGTQDKVEVIYAKGSGSNMYMKDGEIRLYSGTTLSFEAPSGYIVTKVVFTGTISNDKKPTADVGTYDYSSKTWTGLASKVTFMGTATSANIATATITLAKSATITLASACTDGTNYFGTYSNESAFVVPEDLTVSAVSVSGGKLTVTDYATGDIVKTGTGVMVSSATAGNHTVLLSSETGTEISGNMLKGSGAGITAEEMSAENTTFYRLTMHNGTQIGFWWGAENGAAFSLAANKAYLAVPESASAPALGFEFGGDTTGISQHLTPNTQQQTYYDLSGRRVAQPTKGLYILNGKKVLVK